MSIGNILDDMGRYEEALEYQKKALGIHEEIGDRIGMARDYNNLGNILGETDKLQEALKSVSNLRLGNA